MLSDVFIFDLLNCATFLEANKPRQFSELRTNFAMFAGFYANNFLFVPELFELKGTLHIVANKQATKLTRTLPIRRSHSDQML